MGEECRVPLITAPKIFVPRDTGSGKPRPLTIDIYVESMDELKTLAKHWCEPVFHTGYMDDGGNTHSYYYLFHGRLRIIYRE